jgi:hypothetical protein
MCCAQPLALGVLAHERLELGDEVGMAAEREVGVDAVLERREPQLLQPRRLDAGELLVELRERRAAPHRQGGVELARRAIGVAGGKGGAPVARQRAERLEVQLAVGDRQRVAGGVCAQRLRRQELAQLRDVDLHHLASALGRVVAPQLVDQAVAGDRQVRVQQQQRQQPRAALLRPARRARRRHRLRGVPGCGNALL